MCTNAKAKNKNYYANRQLKIQEVHLTTRYSTKQRANNAKDAAICAKYFVKYFKTKL
jgi:hypothetical protein